MSSKKKQKKEYLEYTKYTPKLIEFKIKEPIFGWRNPEDYINKKVTPKFNIIKSVPEVKVSQREKEIETAPPNLLD